MKNRISTLSPIVFGLMLSFHAQATECKGKFCVGNWVIDSDKSVGQLSGFPDENTGRYQIGTSRYDAPLSILKIEVSELSGLKAERKMIDSDDSVGEVVHVFEDARVQYQMGTSKYISSKASPEVTVLNSIHKDTVIIDTDNSVGVAVAVFANKKVQYQLGTSKYISSAAVGEVDARGNIKAGITVIDSDNSIGSVVHVFNDGRVQYQLGTRKYITTKAVAATNALNGIQVGNVAIDSDNSIGKVKFVFEDGRVAYSLGTSTYISSHMVPKVDEYQGLKAGIFAIDPDDSVGTIQYVFRDGRASYKLGSSTYISSHMSKEVDSHPLYQKGVSYSLANYAMGKAIRFFENQRVQLELFNGGTTAGKDLFAAVERIEGYSMDQVVSDAPGRDAVIKMVFANGAVAYQLTSPANELDKVKILTGKIYAFFLEQNQVTLLSLQKEEQKGWLVDLAESLDPKSSASPFSFRFARYISVATPNKLPEIKKSLLERLNAEPAIIGRGDLRKKVRAYLEKQ